MSKQNPATRPEIDRRAGLPQWCREARKIVAYPQDYGMTRQQVRGIERMLANRLRAGR